MDGSNLKIKDHVGEPSATVNSINILYLLISIYFCYRVLSCPSSFFSILSMFAFVFLSVHFTKDMPIGKLLFTVLYCFMYAYMRMRMCMSMYMCIYIIYIYIYS